MLLQDLPTDSHSVIAASITRLASFVATGVEVTTNPASVYDLTCEPIVLYSILLKLIPPRRVHTYHSLDNTGKLAIGSLRVPSNFRASHFSSFRWGAQISKVQRRTHVYVHRQTAPPGRE